MIRYDTVRYDVSRLDDERETETEREREMALAPDIPDFEKTNPHDVYKEHRRSDDSISKITE